MQTQQLPLTGPALAHSPPTFDVPALACDGHVHVFGHETDFPLSPERRYNPEQASADQLKQHLALLGMGRVVIVQPSPYGTDNACTLDAVRRLGERARAVAVMDLPLDESRLAAMHAAGVRGLRFNLQSSDFGSLQDAAAAIQATARVLARCGWHLQLYNGLEAFEALHETLCHLPVPVVLDHFGGALHASGEDDPRLARLLDALAAGRIHLKLSGAYLGPPGGPAMGLERLLDLCLRAGPGHVLWGSNWPHPMPPPGRKRSREGIEPLHQVDDGAALNLVATRAAQPAMPHGVLERLLVTNPERLFWSDR